MRRTTSGVVPVPDPTLLTTQQLIRELSISRELLESKISCVLSTIEMRLKHPLRGLRGSWKESSRAGQRWRLPKRRRRVRALSQH
jgi:hypothetical protein